MAIKVIYNKEPAPGKLKKAELYALSVGMVIGAGVITLIVPAAKMTGYSAWLAYFVAIIVGFVMVLPNILISSAVRTGGGHYSTICGLGGPKVAGIYAFTFLTQCISLSLFGSSAAAYVGDIIPILGSSTARTIVAVILLTAFYVLNLMDIKLMAGVQKYMTWILIAALILFAGAGCLKLRLPIFNFSDPGFAPQGWGLVMKNGRISGGFLGAVLLFLYSCNGYNSTPSYGGAAKNATRDIPFVMMLTVPTLMILYCTVAMAGVGTLTSEEYGSSTTLVFAAQQIFSKPLFIIFIIGGPIMALLTTLNSSFSYMAINIGQSCDDGWLPVAFGKKNKHGARVWVLTFIYAIGVIPIIFGLSITTLTNMLQLIGSFNAILFFISYINLPKLYPKAWKASRYHIPDVAYRMVCTITLLLNMVVLWKSCLSITPTLAIINVGAIVLVSAIGFYRGRKGNIIIHTSIWSYDEEENMRAAALIAEKS